MDMPAQTVVEHVCYVQERAYHENVPTVQQAFFGWGSDTDDDDDDDDD